MLYIVAGGVLEAAAIVHCIEGNDQLRRELAVRYAEDCRATPADTRALGPYLGPISQTLQMRKVDGPH